MLCIFSSLSQLLSANHSMLLIGRLGRSSVGYGGGSRSSISSQDSHGMYSSRQGMSYGGGGFFLLIVWFIIVSIRIFVSYILMYSMSGSFGSGDVGGMYSSSYGGDYISRGSDVMILVFLSRYRK